MCCPDALAAAARLPSTPERMDRASLERDVNEYIERTVTRADELAPARAALVAADDALKAVTNVERVTRNLETFDVQNRPHSALAYPNLAVVRGVVEACDPGASTLVVRPFDSTAANTTETIAYDQLCVCVGAEPRRALDPCDRSASFAARRVSPIRILALSLGVR